MPFITLQNNRNNSSKNLQEKFLNFIHCKGWQYFIRRQKISFWKALVAYIIVYENLVVHNLRNDDLKIKLFEIFS